METFRRALLVAGLLAIAAPGARGQSAPLKPANAKPFLGVWVIEMTEPAVFKGTHTIRVWDNSGTVAASSALASDDARARAVHDEFGAVAPKFVELTNAVVLDDLWRSDLSPRDRSLVTIAALAASADDELEVYLRRGLESGLTRIQITEAVTHVAFYAGWSKATKAMRALTRTLDK